MSLVPTAGDRRDASATAHVPLSSRVGLDRVDPAPLQVMHHVFHVFWIVNLARSTAVHSGVGPVPEWRRTRVGVVSEWFRSRTNPDQNPVGVGRTATADNAVHARYELPAVLSCKLDHPPAKLRGTFFRVGGGYQFGATR